MAVAALSPVRQALAHASLLSAVPADGVTLREPPKIFRLEFNEPVSPLPMRLVRPNGEVVALPEAAAENNIVTIAAAAMADQGSYVLSWRVVSADGHPVGGVVSFAVGHPSSGVRAPPVEGATAVHAAVWATQFVLAIGLFIGAGGAAFAAWLAAKRPLPRQKVLVVIMTVGLAAALVSVPMQGLDALARPLAEAWQPVIWAAGFATSWGLTVVVAVLTLVAGLAALGLPHRSLVLAAALLAMIGFALVVSGHASTAAPRLLSVPAVFVHGVCVAFWIGSLLPLIVTVAAGDHVALTRFSRLIPLPLVFLVASGIVLACVQLDRPDALWTTDYGRVLSAKIFLVLLLLGLGALNRYALVPRLDTVGPRLLLRSMAVELGLAVAILGLVGLWRFTPPPRALAATETSYIHLHGAPAMAQIDLTPERDRGAAVNIEVSDDDFQPIAVKEVALVIWKPSEGIEPIRREAVPAGEGMWRIAGLRIPVGGVWRMRVEVLIDDFHKSMLEDNVELPRAP